jgi:hypothetical protein
VSKRAVEHHTKEADHHEHPARHHEEAAKHHESGNYVKVTHYAHLEYGNHQLSNRHSAEAKAHVEHYGDMIIRPATLATVRKKWRCPTWPSRLRKLQRGQRKHPT